MRESVEVSRSNHRRCFPLKDVRLSMRFNSHFGASRHAAGATACSWRSALYRAIRNITQLSTIADPQNSVKQ